MRRIVVLCMCLIALVLVGCSEEKVWQENAVVYALEAEPSDLDPAMTTSLPESIAELQIFEGLTRLDKDNVPQPALAERWNVSDDGKTWTFVLRPGLVWSDGTAITADDFVYSWLRVLSPEKASENAYMLFCIDKAEEYFSEKATAEDVGIKALDHRTLQVRLKNPVPYFLNLTAFHCFYVVPRQAVEKNPDTWAATADFPCSGPFRITSWIHSGEIDFVKNEHYWDATAVRTESLQFPISDSQATRLTMVESGQADMMTEPPPADEARLEEKGLYRVAPYSGLYYYVFNVTVPPFDDVRVRRAFAEAIERKNLVEHVVRSHKQPAYSLVSPEISDSEGHEFRQAGGDLQYEDAAEAKRLLQEAYGNKMLPEITVLYNTNELHKAIAESLQDMWKRNLGVTVYLRNQESKVFMEARANGDYQIARASWIADYDDPMTFLEVFSAQDNDAQYHNPKYNALIEEAQQTNDKTRRNELMHEAEKLLFDDCVIIPIYYTTQPYVVRPGIKEYHWSPLGLIDFKYAYKEQVR